MKNLDRSLQISTPGDREIAMTRIFDAAPALVFQALTEPHLVRRWLLGPDGWTMPVAEIDLRIGGAYRYIWHGPNGQIMGMRGIYLELVPPARIVQTENFDDPWYAGEAVVTTTLAEHDGHTIMTTTVRYQSQETRDSILKSGMTRGVAASYDRLADLVEKAPSAASFD